MADKGLHKKNIVKLIQNDFSISFGYMKITTAMHIHRPDTYRCLDNKKKLYFLKGPPSQGFDYGRLEQGDFDFTMSINKTSEKVKHCLALQTSRRKTQP